MARLLNAICFWSLVLSTVSLGLAVLAAPIGEVKADVPGGGGAAAPDPCMVNNGNEAACRVSGCYVAPKVYNCRYTGACYCPQ